jgi:hypothetical protein
MTNERQLAVIEIPVDPDDRAYDSKAMSGLTQRNRLFVVKMLQQGVNPKAAPRAAVECGYKAEHGWKLMRNPDIIQALREEATKRLAGAALLGINVMLDIASTPGHKDQYKAAKDLAAINGFTAEQRIVVEHISEDSKAQLRQIRDMATQLGMDPKQLIEAAGIIDAEYEEVKEAILRTANDGAGVEVEIDDSDW